MKPGSIDTNEHGEVVFSSAAKFIEPDTRLVVVDIEGKELTITGLTYVMGGRGLVVQLKARKAKKAVA